MPSRGGPAGPAEQQGAGARDRARVTAADLALPTLTLAHQGSHAQLGHGQASAHSFCTWPVSAGLLVAYCHRFDIHQGRNDEENLLVAYYMYYLILI